MEFGQDDSIRDFNVLLHIVGDKNRIFLKSILQVPCINLLEACCYGLRSAGVWQSFDTSLGPCQPWGAEECDISVAPKPASRILNI